jgi:ubiquinone/menaquinone biosynthesis C-methylase UbiE
LKVKEYIKCRLIGTQHEGASYFDNMLRMFDENLRTYIPNNILDVGCGIGDKTIRMANHFNIDIRNAYGVDYDDQHVIASKKRFNAEKIDLEADDLPYDDNMFDLVICNQVLEHLKNYRKVIDDLIRVTKKGGYIAVGIPNLAHLINRIYLLFGIQPMCIHLDSSHVRSFTHKSFVKMLASLQGVKLIDCKGALMYPLPLIIAKFLAKHFVGLSGYTCYLLRKIQ